MVRKYKKNPVVIEAVRWNGKNLFEILSFMNKMPHLQSEIDKDRFKEYENYILKAGLKIKTLEGVMDADIGDFIIKGIRGEFYPCKPDIFKESYASL